MLYLKEQTQERVQKMEQNKKLFEGKLYEVFGMADYPFFESYKPTNTELAYTTKNWFKKIVSIYSNFLTDAKIEFSNETNQNWYENFKKRNRFDYLLTEITKANLYYGNLPVQVTTGKDSLAKIKLLNPCFWVPIVNDDSYEEPEVHYFYKKTEKKETDKEKKDYYLETAFRVGSISYRIYEKETEVDFLTFAYLFPELEGLQLTQTEFGWTYQTNLDFNLITIFKNESVPGEYFGKSEFSEPLKSLVFEYCMNLVRISQVLNDTTDPLLTVPASVIENVALENTNRKDTQETGLLSMIDSFNSSQQLITELQKERIKKQIKNKASIIGVNSKDDVVPSYVEQSGSMVDKAQNHLKILESDILSESDISEVLTNPDIGTNITGVGIKKLMQLTINKVYDKALNYKYELSELIYKCMVLDNINGESVTPEQPDVIIDVMLEKEKLVQLQELELMDSLNTVTDLDKVMIAREMETKQAQETLEKIKSENKEKEQEMINSMPSLELDKPNNNDNSQS